MEDVLAAEPWATWEEADAGASLRYVLGSRKLVVPEQFQALVQRVKRKLQEIA